MLGSILSHRQPQFVGQPGYGIRMDPRANPRELEPKNCHTDFMARAKLVD